MLNDYLRAWHAGAGKWGNNTDINSSSIGIELDNNGSEPFAEAQITSLLKLLANLKKTYNIPPANFIGHSDIAPTRKNDPSATFPWPQLAQHGFGLWYDADALENIPLTDTAAFPVVSNRIDTTLAVVDSLFNPGGVPAHFNPAEALRIIGYDVSDLEAAIKAFKLHFIQTEVNSLLTESDIRVLHNLYRKYL
jgi:N-acetylmuramoyl-L-alanine amidase